MIAHFRFPAGALAAVCSIAAAWFVGSGATPVDARLPLIAAVVAILGIATPGAAGRVAEILPVVLILAAVAVMNDPLRLLAYGIVVATAFALVVASRSEDHALPFTDAALVLTMFLVLLFAIPELDYPVRAGLAAVGSLAFLWAGAREGRVRGEWLVLAATVAVATPLIPGRASLFPLLLAIALRAVWDRSAVLAFPAVVLGIVVGPWTAAIWVAVVLALVFRRARPADASAALPAFAAGSVAPLAPALLMFPRAFQAFRNFDGAVWSAAAVCGAAALVVRPALALLYALAAVAILLQPRAGRESGASALTSGFALAMVAMFPWSGALQPFLLFWPGGEITAVALVAVALTAALLRSSAAISILAAAAAVAALTLAPPRAAVEPIERSIAAGEETFIKPGRLTQHLEVALSGAQMNAVGPDSRVGSITVVETGGRAFSREIFGRDLADWAAFRSDLRFASRTAIPRRPAPRLSGFGNDAFLTGAGSIRIEGDERISLLRFAADRDLPPTARLQIDALTYEGER